MKDTAKLDGRIATFLLFVAVLGLLGTAFFSVAWVLERSSAVDVEELSSADRQALVEEMIKFSPGVFIWTWFEPRIGYSFPPGKEVKLWYDTFQANDLGYRSGSVEKAPGTFRVVFVGDSWTFGQGIKEAESFPKVFERLANETSGLDRRVEAWTLALPGYNLMNELAALSYFMERLEPDAVVLAPTPNDNHTGNNVLPNGSSTRSGVLLDQFGDSHSLKYTRTAMLDSYRFKDRWRLAFQKVRKTEEYLKELGIPFMVFFAARWDPPFPHHLVQEAGLTSRYAITPKSYAVGHWLNPPPDSHGNAEANEVYGRIVYQGMAQVLGWPPLSVGEPGSEVPSFGAVPPEADWKAHADALFAAATREHIPETFHPSKDARRQCPGPMDCRSGLMGRATTVLVRRSEGTQALEIGLGRIPGKRYLYPLRMKVSIPSPDGGTSLETVVPAGRGELPIFRLAIPDDIAAGAALDVVFEAERYSADRERLISGSVYIRSIEQVGSL